MGGELNLPVDIFSLCSRRSEKQPNRPQTLFESERGAYGTARFKLYIYTRVLVDSLTKFDGKLASFLRVQNATHVIGCSTQVHLSWGALACSYFTREVCYM